jgi:hypothetical protein
MEDATRRAAKMTMLDDEMSTPEVEGSTRPTLEMTYDLDHIGRSIEAILMVVDEPVTEITLWLRLFERPVDEIRVGVGQLLKAHDRSVDSPSRQDQWGMALL